MISGFNTDVEHRGQVFHVQTEEKGPDNPVVVTLVYCGGQIVGSREVSYGEAAEAASLVEDELRLRMREQHQVLIREIRTGRFDPPPMPYGHDFVTDRSFDEIVLDYLETSIDEIRATAAEGASAAEGLAPSPLEAPAQANPERAAQVARVLQRLGRFLDAAERAGVEPAVGVPASTPTEIPAPWPDAPEADVSSEALPAGPAAAPCPDAPRSVEADAEAAPQPPARRRSSRRLAVAALLAIVSGAAVLMFLPQRISAPPSETTVAPPRAPSTQTADEPREPTAGAANAVPDEPAGAEPAAPVPEPAAPPPDTASARSAEPPAASPPAHARSSEPRRRDGPPAAGAAEPAPVRQAAVIPAPGAPPPAVAPPDLSRTFEEPSPSEPSVRPGQLFDVASVDVTPRPRSRDLPRYTARARRAGEQGTVELRLLIDERGDVADAELVRNDAGAELAEESMSMVRSWTFSPARKDRQPVKVWQDVALEFTILPNRSTSVRIRE